MHLKCILSIVYHLVKISLPLNNKKILVVGKNAYLVIFDQANYISYWVLIIWI